MPVQIQDPDELVRGLAADDRRRVRRQRADGRDGLVPEQQPPARQGDLRLPHHGAGHARPRSATASSSRRSTTPTARRPGTGTWATRWRRYLSTSTVGCFDYRRRRRRDRASARAATRSSSTTRSRARSSADAEGEPRTRPRGARGRDRQVHRRLDRRAVPVRLARRGRCTAAAASATCSRSRPSPLPGGLDQPQHARARDRAPVVRQQRVARRSGRHLAQRGLGDAGGQWNWSNKQNNSATTVERVLQRLQLRDHRHAGTSRRRACPSAANLFDTFPVYTRPAAMLEGLPPDRRRRPRSSRSSGAAGRARATATPTRPTSSRWRSGSRRSEPASRLEPGQARHVLPAVALHGTASRR